MSKRKILVIAKTPPLHDRSGADHRLFQLMGLLAPELDVSFLSTWHAVRHRFKERHVSPIVRDGSFPREKFAILDEKYLADLRELGVRTLNQPEPVPFTVRPLNEYDIRPFLRAERYDAIWLEYFYLADQYLDQIRQLQPWAQVIVDTVDLHYLRMERQTAHLESRVGYSVSDDQERVPLADGFAKEMQDRHNYDAHVMEHELRAYAKCDRIVVTSDDDERELRQHLPHADILVAPNVYDARLGPVPGPGARKGVTYLGNFDHAPNPSAAIFLKHEIAPRVVERLGPVPFRFVGNNPPYVVRKMAKLGPCAPQCQVTGQVPDPTVFLDRARASVAPVFFGSGMAAKIGESLAAGVPVVTTPLGALGYGLVHEQSCLVADTAEEFALAIERLHRDDALWETLSRGGLEVAARYRPEAVGPAFRAAIAGALPPPTKARPAKAPRASEALPAARFPRVKDPEISVVLLAYNQWPYTELCLRSLAHAQKHSPRLRVEYILVDNNSSDGTAEAAAKIPGLKVIANKRNLGFAAGNNVGIRAARGKSVVLLNNDTLVAPFWLQRLHDHANRIGRAGIIGPSTNTEPGQALFGARYSGLGELFAFNREIGRANRGQWELCEKISGLCMYIPREVIEKVGVLSEDYGLGYFEDDDYCFRVRDAGYRTIRAKDTYVHHFGSVSFENSGKNREKHLSYGMSQFIFKWGKRALKHIAQSHRQTLIKPAEVQLHN